MTKFFIDTEFIEDGVTIDLIGIAIVSMDGREFYAINEDCDFSKANDWVKQNVLAPMGIEVLGSGNLLIEDEKVLDVAMSPLHIKDEILKFVYGTEERPTVDGYLNTPPKFWGYYCDYDWVVFCWLFGSMIALPNGFPMYCRDLKQTLDELGNPKLPEQTEGEHNALADAKWIRDSYLWLKQNYEHPAFKEQQK